jgi:hypothetical protein
LGIPLNRYLTPVVEKLERLVKKEVEMTKEEVLKDIREEGGGIRK